MGHSPSGKGGFSQSLLKSPKIGSFFSHGMNFSGTLGPVCFANCTEFTLAADYLDELEVRPSTFSDRCKNLELLTSGHEQHATFNVKDPKDHPASKL